VAAAGAAQEDRQLVLDQLAAEAGEDGRAAGETCPLLLATAGREPSDAAVSEKLMEQATTAGVQDSRKAEESCSDHLGEGKCTERARLETNGCILSGAGTPKSEFRLKGVNPPVSTKTPALPTEPDHLEAALADAATEHLVPYGKGYGHQHEIPPFTRGKDAVDYARKRYQAHAHSRK
jgi:hypothetical protein